MRHTDLVEASRKHHYKPPASGLNTHPFRQPFHKSHTSLGAAGHLLHLGMVAAPLIIGEAIHDCEKRWRAMRMVPVLGAIASEVLWTAKLSHDRKKEEEARAALQECRDHCR
jgi:hypothetical protein